MNMLGPALFLKLVSEFLEGMAGDISLRQRPSSHSFRHPDFPLPVRSGCLGPPEPIMLAAKLLLSAK
jgi:hypothetical protein